jgi:hypothetical protein
MLEQGEVRVVQRDIGGGLCAGRMSEHAGQGRREEENAIWCRHRVET